MRTSTGATCNHGKPIAEYRIKIGTPRKDGDYFMQPTFYISKSTLHTTQMRDWAGWSGYTDRKNFWRELGDKAASANVANVTLSLYMKERTEKRQTKTCYDPVTGGSITFSF